MCADGFRELTATKRVFRAESKQGQVVMIPPGCLVIERCPEKNVGYGVKVPVLNFASHSKMWLEAWERMKDAKRHPHYAQMVTVKELYSPLA